MSYIAYVLLGVVMSWALVGLVLLFLQLRFNLFLGRWVCRLWGCTSGYGDNCPNCQRRLTSKDLSVGETSNVIHDEKLDTSGNRLPFFTLELLGVEVCADRELRHPITTLDGLRAGQTVFAPGMMHEVIELEVTAVRGTAFDAQSSYIACGGRFQEDRATGAAWVAEFFGNRDAIARAEF